MGIFLTDTDCIKQREYVNIPAWHKAGYLGQGQAIFYDDVGGNHVDIVSDAARVILPKAKVYTGNIGYTKISGVIQECRIKCTETGEILPFDDFVQKYNITLINNSVDGGRGEEILPEALYMREKIKQYNLIFSGAAGNAYGMPTEQPYNGACVIISAVKFSNGNVVYSPRCEGPNIDFAMFQGFNGATSFASSFWVCLAGLLRSKNPNITQTEFYQYCKDHRQDVGTPGKDIRGGWGLPILGDPNEEMEKDEVTVTETKIKVDGQIKTVRRILYKGENYIRLRDFEDVLGVVDVEYDEANKLPIVED